MEFREPTNMYNVGMGIGSSYFGIDLGAKRIHVVSVDTDLNLGSTYVIDAADLSELETVLQGSAVVAIDAPAALSTAPHADDETLSPKFRTARCAEIALARDRGIWVPWVTPTAERVLPSWMAKGFEVFEVAQSVCPDVIEVYPHAGFRTLAGATLPSKQSAAGLRARVDLLRDAGLDVPALEMWSHDSLDAAVAALIARRKSRGEAVSVSCAHDSSAIWLPQPG
jgi:predicted nuclease with RNAse H fold